MIQGSPRPGLSALVSDSTRLASPGSNSDSLGWRTLYQLSFPLHSCFHDILYTPKINILLPSFISSEIFLASLCGHTCISCSICIKHSFMHLLSLLPHLHFSCHQTVISFIMSLKLTHHTLAPFPTVPHLATLARPMLHAKQEENTLVTIHIRNIADIISPRTHRSSFLHFCNYIYT